MLVPRVDFGLPVGRFSFALLGSERRVPWQPRLRNTSPEVGVGDALAETSCAHLYPLRVPVMRFEPERLKGYAGLCWRNGASPEFGA